MGRLAECLLLKTVANAQIINIRVFVSGEIDSVLSSIKREYPMLSDPQLLESYPGFWDVLGFLECASDRRGFEGPYRRFAELDIDDIQSYAGLVV